MAKRRISKDSWAHILPALDFPRTVRGRRVIRCYFEIEDDFLLPANYVEAHDTGFREAFGIRRFSSPSCSFPLYDSERQKLVKIASKLETDYSDSVTRQIYFASLKESLLQLREKVTLESRTFLRVLNMCCDALQNVKSEQLTRNHVDNLKFVIENMKEDMDDFWATELQGILVGSGLKPTPTVEGIAEFY